MTKAIPLLIVMPLISFQLYYGITTTVFYDMDIIEQNPELIQQSPIQSHPTTPTSEEDYFVDFNTPYVEKQNNTNETQHIKQKKEGSSFSSMSTQYSGKIKDENEEFFNFLKTPTTSGNKKETQKDELYFYDF